MPNWCGWPCVSCWNRNRPDSHDLSQIAIQKRRPVCSEPPFAYQHEDYLLTSLAGKVRVSRPPITSEAASTYMPALVLWVVSLSQPTRKG
jgi:hypothetical protein